MHQLTGEMQDLYYFDLKLLVLPYILPSNHKQICQALLMESNVQRQSATNVISKQSVKLDISPLVSQLKGKIGCQKKWNVLRNSMFLGFSRCFSEKKQLKPRKSNFLKNFPSLDTHLDPQLVRLVDIYPVLHFVQKFDNSSVLFNFFFVLQSNT